MAGLSEAPIAAADMEMGETGEVLCCCRLPMRMEIKRREKFKK